MIINARFLTQPITGVQRYAIEISLRLKKLDPSIKFVAPKNIMVNDISKQLEVEIVGNCTGYFWEQIELPLYLKKNGSPLLINLANMAPIFYKNKITSIHDIAFVKFSIGFSWKFKTVYKVLIPLVIKTSKKIITISQFSKKEIMDYYRVDSNKIKIIYNGVDKNFSQKKRKYSERYILGVSSLDHRKNFKRLIEAYSQIENPDFKLYIIGDKNSVFQTIDVKSHANIHFLGRVSDEDLVQYYSDSLLFVYPSLYEGFGFPPLEAMACETPVVTSNVTSIPEICDDTVVYCEPYNISDIKEKIELVLNDEALQERLIVKGLKRVQMYSWEKSAEEHLRFFESVLNGQ